MDILVYCRFSTEMQNPRSCDDQERAVKAGLRDSVSTPLRPL